MKIKNNSKVYYNGSKWESNNCGELEIVGKSRRDNKKNSYYFCKFDDGTVVELQGSHIKNGTVNNPNHKSVYEVGFIGQGIYKCKENGKLTKEYSIWRGIIQRCYSKLSQEIHPTYKDCIVDTRWHNFQNFCKDIKQFNNYEDWKNDTSEKNIWELDKDIICEELNISPKIYSKNTCKLVTKKENMEEANKRNKNNRMTGLTYIGTRILDGYEEEFTNQYDFSVKYNLNNGNVNTCIKRKRNYTGGWKFKIKESEAVQ